MTNTNSNKDSQNSGVSPLVAAVTGAVVGAGVAVAGAVALKDEKTRDKVKETLSHVKDEAMKQVENLQELANEKKDEAEEALKDGKAKLAKHNPAK